MQFIEHAHSNDSIQFNSKHSQLQNELSTALKAPVTGLQPVVFLRDAE
jgi:hypothetical protein